jgi:hypothetical protein
MYIKRMNLPTRRENRIKKIVIKMIFIIIVLNTILIIFPGSTQVQAQTQGLAYVKIEFDDMELKPAEVGLAKTGVVNYTGRLVIDRNYFYQQRVVVNLYADAGGEGWAASINPPQLIFLATEKAIPFTLFVVAPVKESVTEQRTVTITGNWQTDPGVKTGEVEPSYPTIPVKSYSHFTIIPTKDYVKVWPTQTAEFELTIVNRGNSEDTFAINILDYENLVAAGYTVILETNTITIDEDSEGTFKFKVSGPPNFYIWKSQQTPIPLRIVAMNSEETEERTVVRFWECMYYEVGFYVPEPCIFGIIVAVVLVVTLVWARRNNRLFWKLR